MNQDLRLYLFTLEVSPLETGKTYNLLPSHLTLIPRFYSHQTPEDIADKVCGLFARFKVIKLTFGPIATIGPKLTAVHLIQPNESLIELHNQLIQILDQLGVEYTQPEYIKGGWTPHISTRDNDNFSLGLTHLCKTVYLIEVHKENSNHLRTIQKEFSLSD